MKLLPTNNQWALAVRVLIEHQVKGADMLIAMSEYYFYKFQTRLLEVEKGREDNIKVRRLPITKKNRFKHVMTFTNYKSLASKSYLINLHNKLCREGVKALKK